MNKRGVSEVIAAVLLVAIVIVIIAIIFTWSYNFVQKKARESKENLYCQELDIAVRQSCYEESTARIAIKNNKDIAVLDDSMVRLEGTTSYVEVPFPPFSTIESFEMKQIEFSYNKSIIGNIQKVMLFPKLILEGKKFFCEGIENEIKAC